MGFFHMFADARMPIWGVSAILSSLLLVVLSKSEQRWFYLASLLMLVLFTLPATNFNQAGSGRGKSGAIADFILSVGYGQGGPKNTNLLNTKLTIY